MAYQAHLREIYDHSLLFGWSFTTTDPACQAIYSALQAEQSKHGVCKTSTQCAVGQASCSAFHTAGIGIDIGGMPASQIQSIIDNYNNTHSDKINLQWKNISNDPVHFNLTNAPYPSGDPQCQ